MEKVKELLQTQILPPENGFEKADAKVFLSVLAANSFKWRFAKRECAARVLYEQIMQARGIIHHVHFGDLKEKTREQYLAAADILLERFVPPDEIVRLLARFWPIQYLKPRIVSGERALALYRSSLGGIEAQYLAHASEITQYHTKDDNVCAMIRASHYLAHIACVSGTIAPKFFKGKGSYLPHRLTNLGLYFIRPLVSAFWVAIHPEFVPHTICWQKDVDVKRALTALTKSHKFQLSCTVAWRKARADSLAGIW